MKIGNESPTHVLSAIVSAITILAAAVPVAGRQERLERRNIVGSATAYIARGNEWYAKGDWERALADPPKYADYILAFEGDPVWQAVHNLPLREVVEVHVTGQARAVLYRAR